MNRILPVLVPATGTALAAIEPIYIQSALALIASAIRVRMGCVAHSVELIKFPKDDLGTVDPDYFRPRKADFESALRLS